MLAPGVGVRGRRDSVITWIGVFKMIKVATLVAAGVTAIALRHRDAASDIRMWADALGVDPGNRYVDRLAGELAGVSPRRFAELGLGSLIYAALFAIEGGGLLAHKLWAEYVTISITTSFVPLEVYELVHRTSAVKCLVIAANVAIVIYLVWRLRRDRRWPFR
jgi:uncharacterized membrane protein (DUF2068 family)